MKRKSIFRFQEKKSILRSYSKVFFEEKSQNMLFARCANYLNKENSDSVKVFSGLVTTLHRK